MQSETLFRSICEALMSKNDQLTEGKMMSSPAIKLNNKVVLFYHDEAMTFKFGPETELYKSKYSGSSYLSPFKNKPPMKGWLSIPSEYKDDWEDLCEDCIQLYER